jgi:pyruvyl transferase EpsI
MNNLSEKVEGVYEWVKDLEYVRFVNALDKLEPAVRSLDLNKTFTYSNATLIKHFNALAQFIRDNAKGV